MTDHTKRHLLGAATTSRPTSAFPPIETGPGPLSYTFKGACDATGLSKTTLVRQIATGKLRAFKVGTRTLINGDSLRALINSAPPAQLRTDRPDAAGSVADQAST